MIFFILLKFLYIFFKLNERCVNIGELSRGKFCVQ